MAVENSCDKVEYPCDGASADNPDDTDNDSEGILVSYALNDTVDCPYDVEEGKAEDDLHKLRKLVNAFYEVFE
jgi:hypothetical protein